MQIENYMIILVVLFVTFFVASNPDAIIPVSISTDGYEQVEVTIAGNDLKFSSACREVVMTVSDHQALSVDVGLRGELYSRPLTHDLMRDIFIDYNIRVLSTQIDSFENEIYTAKLYIQKENKVLELDARPTDAVGIATRLNLPVHFNSDILNEQGTNTCV